ncbi:porphobilinogen deaminase [Beauveria asiatica]|uniref:Porphobilinogen deaminase n=1 Tax=Beauveria asiatica TaxID=1069075 RepID=A0AAW0S902_9HYPO
MRTLGDRDKITALYSFEGKNLWTSELEDKLTAGKVDVIVHCLKDMPTNLPEDCELAVIPARDDARDALIIKADLPFTSLQTLPEGAVVGTSSVRRTAQLRRLYPHLRFANLRGNVETRLAKVDSPDGEYACTIMSAAGLERMGLQSRISQLLGSRDGGIYAAVGQGALGLEIRRGDAKTQALLRPLADERAMLACLAERALLRRLEGGCTVPVGAETEWVAEHGEGARELRLRAIVVSLDGKTAVENAMERVVETNDEAEALGYDMADVLVKAGARDILQAIVANRQPKE